MGAIIGPMVSANWTQTGFSGSTVPSPGMLVRPAANDLRELVERLVHGRVAEELSDGGHACGRARIEEGRAGGGVLVVAVLLGEDAVDGEEIAQDAGAAFRRLAVTGDGSHIAGAIADGAEDIKIDCCFEGCGALMRLQHVEDDGRSQRTIGMVRRLHNKPPWFNSNC